MPAAFMYPCIGARRIWWVRALLTIFSRRRFFPLLDLRVLFCVGFVSSAGTNELLPGFQGEITKSVPRARTPIETTCVENAYYDSLLRLRRRLGTNKNGARSSEKKSAEIIFIFRFA